MNKIIAMIASLAALLAQPSTYTFSWTGGGKSDSSGDSLVMNVADVNTTKVNILTVGLSNGCDSEQVYSYSPVSGPALVVGEWVKVVVNNLPGYSGNFQIVALGNDKPDGSGNPTFTVNFRSCFTGGSGTAYAGSSANPFFNLGVPAYDWEAGVKCQANSSFPFTLLHSDGTLTSEIANNPTCSTSSPAGSRNVTLTASFSGTLSSGQPFTGTFSTSGYIGECRCYLSGKFIATSASWSVTTPIPIDTLVGGGTGGGGH